MTLTELLLSGGVSVALIGILGKYLEFRWTNRKKGKATIDVIKAVANIYEMMHRVTSETAVQRMVIFKAENGGGKPKVGAHIYVSAIMESIRTPVLPIVNEYQRLRADASYIELLSEVVTKGHAAYKSSEMPQSLLKTIYLAEKIKYSEVYFLHVTEDAIYYCSVATTEQDDFTEPATALAIQIAIDRISEIFRKNL